MHAEPSDARPAVVEEMSLADLPQVVAIERASFADPWPLHSFVDEFRNGQSGRLVARASDPPRLVGYAIYWLAGDELHLNNLGIKPEARRHGVARALVADVLGRGAARGAAEAWLEVRRSNVAARALYAALGFALRGRRRSYYADNGEDALLYGRALATPGPAGPGREGST